MGRAPLHLEEDRCGLRNKPQFFRASSPPRLKPLCLSVFHKSLFLCLKGITAACFGPFFESHIFLGSRIYKLNVFSSSSVLCQFNYEMSQRSRKGGRESALPTRRGLSSTAGLSSALKVQQRQQKVRRRRVGVSVGGDYFGDADQKSRGGIWMH